MPRGSLPRPLILPRVVRLPRSLLPRALRLPRSFTLLKALRLPIAKDFDLAKGKTEELEIAQEFEVAEDFVGLRLPSWLQRILKSFEVGHGENYFRERDLIRKREYSSCVSFA